MGGGEDRAGEDEEGEGDGEVEEDGLVKRDHGREDGEGGGGPSRPRMQIDKG